MLAFHGRHQGQQEIIAFAAEYRLPAIYQWREHAEAGGWSLHHEIQPSGVSRGIARALMDRLIEWKAFADSRRQIKGPPTRSSSRLMR